MRDLLQGGRRPAVGFPLGKVQQSSASSQTPLDTRLTAKAEEYAGMYAEVPNGLGSLKSIGKAHIDADGLIQTNATPWEFQAWIPFAPRRVLQLEGAILSVNLEVLEGAVDIGILAEDGSTLLGDRFRASTGRHSIQLSIPSNEVKGLVVCNCGPDAQASRLKFEHISVRRFEEKSAAAQSWAAALEEAENYAGAETSHAEDIPNSAPLVVNALLAHGRFHDAKLLLNAAALLTGKTRPSWWSIRMDEQLTDHLRLAKDRPSMSAGTLTSSDSQEDEGQLPLLSEWAALSPVFGQQKFAPLHFEILELGLLLDLLGTGGGHAVQFEWQRSGLASPLVRRGALTNLLRVLNERLEGNLSQFSIVVRTDQSETSVTIRSGLQHGDLQYRHFSAAVVKLLRAVNSQQGAAPDLTHELGEESTLCLSWTHEAHDLELAPISVNSAPESVSQLYQGAAGSQVLVRGDLGYKFSPADSSKLLTASDEAAVLADLADLGGTIETVAIHEDETGSWMSFRFAQGTPLSAKTSDFDNRIKRSALLRSLSDLISHVNHRGVQHRDLRAENLLITPSDRLVLLDFDQAQSATQDDDFGNEWDEERACAGVGGLIRQLGWESDFLKTAGSLSVAWELGRHSAANSPGKHANYYDWQWGPLHLNGERPWTARWQLLAPAFANGSGTFLELGSNLGMLSTYAALHGWEARGLERDGVAVAAAELIAQSLGSGATFAVADLTSPDTWAESEDVFDLVSALSVVHWLPDPSPVEAFLRRQPRLLFEGHRSAAEESDYLRSLGFMSVELLGYSERLRPVLIASKS